jgi:DNA gyrase subunit A
MNELGLTSKAKFRKSATVVGDVLGKYHPHGDVAVYDSLVRMAQNFAMRYPLIWGQGNFGSIDGDPAAAMRYTECKMSRISECLLTDIDKDTVDFIDNYDATRTEPAVLPGKLPNLLINGTVGIAVGMATNIPPHNLGEVIDATCLLIDNPDATPEELMKHVKGPDFPTAGIIYNKTEIQNAYATGKGRIVMRAKADILKNKKGYFRIEITEIPYQVNKSVLITKIAELVKTKKITGIANVIDESDKDGIRITIDLKKDAFAKKILNQLFKFTQMQETFGVNMLALVDGIKPSVLTLKNILEEYLKHRQVVIKRRTEFELRKAKERLHILEGLLVALDSIDSVIETIKKSQSRDAAEKNLIAKFKLSKIQANAILEMRLSVLAKLESDKIKNEYEEIKKLISKLENILANPEQILKIIKDEILELKAKFDNVRRTKIVDQAIDNLEQEDLIPNERVIICFTNGNYVKRLPVDAYRAQLRGGKGVLGMATKEEDIVQHLLVANNHDTILYFTNKGRVFSSKAFEILQSSRQSKGQAVVNLLQIAPDETITGLIKLSDTSKMKYLLMATKNGLVKKTPITAFSKVRKSGLIAIKLRKDDELKWVKPTSGENQIIIVSKKGQSIRFWEKDCRPMGRSTTGIRGIKLRAADSVVGMDIVHTSDKNQNCDLLIVTERGTGKRTALLHYPIQRRGGIGLRTARLSAKTGDIIQMQIVDAEDSDLVLISRKGQVIRLALKNAKRIGRSTCGVRLMKLKENDHIAAMTIISREEIPESELDNDKSSHSAEASASAKASTSAKASASAKATADETVDETADEPRDKKTKKIEKEIPKETKNQGQKVRPRRLPARLDSAKRTGEAGISSGLQIKKPEKITKPAKAEKPKETQKPKFVPKKIEQDKILFSKKPIAKIEHKADLPKDDSKKSKFKTKPNDSPPQFTKRKIGEKNAGEDKNYWDANNWQKPKE